ncbi:MAG: hypothetical protein KDG50_12005 [Chromatiales bacterium]|nr:hypothetical protein [Chromatiales bacterium]
MAIRIKSRWHDSQRNEAADKSLHDAAGALAFIAWRLALDKAKNLHGQDFVYRTDGQRVAVICEYLAFCVQIADRLVHRMGYDDGDRRVFIEAFARRVAEHVEDNAIDLFGPGDYRSGFIATLNERAGEYADYGYDDDGPAYSFLHLLGQKILGIMGSDQTNKWAIDQVMEIDAPAVDERLRKALTDLLS